MASGEEIFRWFKEGRIGPLEYAGREIVALAKEFEDDAEHLDVASKTMLGYWEGEGADKASKGMGPLIDGHRQSAPMVIDAGSSVSDQGSLLVNAKNSVVEVPPEPKEPSPWARMSSAILPGTPDPDVSYREGMNRHNDANAVNVRVMDQYGVGTGGTRSSLPSDYGIMADDGAAIHIGSTSASSVSGPSGAAPTFGGGGTLGGGGGGGGFGGNVGPGPSFGGGGGGGLPGGGTSGVGPGPTPSPGAPPGGGLPVRPGPGPMPIVGPVGGPPGAGSDSDRRAGRTAAGKPAAGSSRAGARMAGTGGGAPKVGSNTVLRGGGSGAAARLTGGTAGLQAGKGAGVGMPGSGAGGATAARAAGGLGGRAGAGGMAGGAGAGRGQGAEDGEHKDKYAIKEELDDGLQVQYDELGVKTIDEKTGNTVVSPVIGEPDYKPGPDPKPEA